MDLKVRPSALGSYSKEKGIQFGAEHLIRFSTKLSLSLNHGAKVRIFPFLPNFCDESSGNLCSVYFQNTIGHNMSNKYYNCLERNGTKYFKLEYTFEQYPGECLSVSEKCLTLSCHAVIPSDVTYCESVFRKSLHENVEVFLAKGCTEQHSLSYRYLWTGTFCVP